MKRFTATEKWQKDWFQSLAPGQKCLWNYLCDNCDAAGVWEPNWRLASFVINETFTGASLAVFGDRVRALPDGKIWLTGFCEFQYSQLSRECRAHTHIIRILEKHGLLNEVSHLLAGAPENPSDTLWYRVPDRDKEKEQEQDKDKDRETDREPSKPDRPGHARASAVSRAAAAPELPLPATGFPPATRRAAARREENNPAAPPVGKVRGGTAAVRRVARRPDVAALGQRLGAIMRRRPGSRWSERERAAADALFPLDDNDLLLIERYYAADIAPPDDIRRRDLLTLLDHWPGELDRARAFWRKRGWRLPAGDDSTEGQDPDDGPGRRRALPEDFAAWKAQAPEYAGTVWREWKDVPSFAREEFHRWRKRTRNEG